MISADKVDIDEDDELPLVVKVAGRMVCGSVFASGCDCCCCGCRFGSEGMVLLLEVELKSIGGVFKFSFVKIIGSESYATYGIRFFFWI